MAGNSVITKKEREIIDEEGRLIEDYYKNYYQTPPRSKKHMANQYSEEKLAKNHVHIRKRSHQRAGNINVHDRTPISSRRSNTIEKKVKRHQRQAAEPEASNLHELNEEERVSLIAKLEKKKQEVWNLIQKLPICQRTSAVEQREKLLFQQLDEVNYQANLLNNKHVYIS